MAIRHRPRRVSRHPRRRRARIPVFSQTWDEPATLATGMEWLSTGDYRYEAQHPPLARVASAVAAVPARRAQPRAITRCTTEGRALLGEGAQYRRTLFLARLGMLPFFCAAARRVRELGRAHRRRARAPRSLRCFAAANPNLLAHAAIAGTDLAPAAFVVAAHVRLAALARAAHDRSRARCSASRWGSPRRRSSPRSRSSASTIALGEAVRWWTRATRRRREPARRAVATDARRARRGRALGVERLPLPRRAHYARRRARARAGVLPLACCAFFTHGSGGHPAFLLGEVRLAAGGTTTSSCSR